MKKPIKYGGHPTIPGFTPTELMSMFGLTVEEAEKKGYKISGRKRKKVQPAESRRNSRGQAT